MMGKELSDDVESDIWSPREGLRTQTRGPAAGRKEKGVRES